MTTQGQSAESPSVPQHLIRELRGVLGDQYVLIEREDVIVYEQDGSIFQVMPQVVVAPADVGVGVSVWVVAWASSAGVGCRGPPA